MSSPDPSPSPTIPTSSTTAADKIDDKSVKLLTTGLLELYEPPLVTVQAHLKELTEKQESVHAALTAERRKLDDLQHNAVAEALIANVAMSRERLIAISRSMVALHKKVNSLQKRAANIERVAKSRAAKQKT